MRKKLIVGYGTGRCGTKSLAEYLSQQPGFAVSHEKVPLSWYPAFTDTEVVVNDFAGRPGQVAVGDVGFYWIHYLDLVLRRFEGAKAINIRRDLDEVIESFWAYLSQAVPPFGSDGWLGYPYDSDKPTKDAVAFTLRRYRYMEHEVGKLYPGSIFLMGMEDLNNPDIMDLLCVWLGVPREGRTEPVCPVHTNTIAEVLHNRNDRTPGRLFKTFRKGVTENDCTNQIS